VNRTLRLALARYAYSPGYTLQVGLYRLFVLRATEASMGSGEGYTLSSRERVDVYVPPKSNL